MSDSFWRESKCQNQWLHRFNIREQYAEGVIEVCEICGMKKFFRVLDGKLNNYEYMSYHFRQALPPFNPYFSREYAK